MKKILLPGSYWRNMRLLSFAAVLGMQLPQPVKAAGDVPSVYQAADIHVKGQITDDQDKTPLIGVSIAIKGTNRGASTDTKGYYSLTVPAGSTLVISHMGYDPKEVKVTKDNTALDISISRSNKTLSEVVVVSYGTQKQREVTGAISTLSAKKLQDMPVAQFAQQLQGKIAGVQVYQTTGKPGGGMAFRIRGAGSLSAGTDPLIVIDGMPVTGSINNINPDEIESFSVLKDAAASALYGSRANNGVILITTRHAKLNETTVNLNAFYGIQQTPQHGRPDVMNAREFAQFQKEFYEDKIKYENWVNPTTGTAVVPTEYQHPEQYGEGTNWYNSLIRDNAPIQNYSLSLSSGREKSSSTVIFGYFNQQGVVKNTGFQRFNLRVNNDFTPNDRVKLGFNIAPSYQLEHNARINTDNTWQILQAAALSTPLVPFRNPDGSYPLNVTSFGMFNNPNWYTVLQQTQDDYKTTRIFGNAYAEILLLKGLKFRTQVNLDMGGETRKYFLPSTAVGALFTAPPGRAKGTYSAYNNYTWLSENTLTYNLELGHHHIDALAGYTASKFKQESSIVNGTDYPNDAIPWINQAATVTGTSNADQWSLLSAIGRLNYNYKGKYLLSGSIRSDGSSRFGSARKYGYFPAVSAGWIVSDEAFMKTIPTVSYLKLRSSYGATGNNNIGNFSQLAAIGTYNYVLKNQLANGKTISQLGNDQLGWEKSLQFDIGVDIGLFNDKVSLSYDYYHKTTDGMLFSLPIPVSSGYGSILANVGAAKFWGHEIGISTRNLSGAVTWTTSFNISFNKNLITKMVRPGFIGATSEYDDYWRNQEGHPMSAFFGYVFDGVYMNQHEFETQPKHATSQVGTVRMKDVNGDGKIDVNDRTFIGDPNPKAIFGLTNDLTYKKFDLSVSMAGSLGGDIIDGIYPYTENLDAVFNVRKEVANRWRSEENPGNGIIPSTRAGTTPLARAINSRYVVNGSFLTVKNITLGYSLPFKSGYIKSLRLYASVQQALVITGYKGMNPETSISGLTATQLGVDKTAYPVPRTFSFGINSRF
ncbi:SusC/RagA family TonB-linked outer membrane protein [Chitinophaga sp. 22321]|uniref:TonB-dependent receptor n=1 Tax=Chitinophaga hostae TaxID=2831022 RepID=A0ABS5J8R0_9BACT|nr:TonB-dependent receptor [Chitinophaga hostae]MBS0031589.1 TonB-dependent receptor [Chitinophaga hostae]